MTRVLVSEDYSATPSCLRGMLEDAGFAVSVAETRLQTIESIRANPPDAFITDVHNLEKDGLDLVEQLNSEFPRLPIILQTSNGCQQATIKALKAGAVSFVPKPLLRKEIIPTLNSVLAVSEQTYNDGDVSPFWTGGDAHYRIKSDPGLIPTIVAQLEKQIVAVGFCDETGLLRIGMALCEALDNAVFHGNLEVDSTLREEDDAQYYSLAQQRRQQAPFRDRHVNVYSRIDRNQAEFVIEDDGPGFNPEKLPDPTDPLNLDRVSGRGLTLIRNMMDEVLHNDRGNRITMIKYCTESSCQPRE